MQQQEESGGFLKNWKQNFNVTYALCMMHQRALTVPMRDRYGVQALGLPCLLALVLMFVWAIFTRDSLMWLWMGYWFLCLLKRRAEAVKLAGSGERIHSQYDGWPFEALRIGRTEKAAKRVVEPILVGIFGGILYWIYGEQGWPTNGLPLFMLTGVFTLPLVEMVKQTIWERRTQAMVDARVEQEQLMGNFRDRFGDY